MSSYRQIIEHHGHPKANSYIFISLKNKYVWFKNPKVMSSTLAATLQSLEIQDLPGREIPPHPEIQCCVHVKPYQLTEARNNQIYGGPLFRKFAFVRNPYARLVSAYKDKVERNEADKRNILTFSTNPDKTFERPVSFEEFIETIHAMPVRRMNRHWEPQVYTTCAHWVKLDFVGKIENANDDLKALETLTGIDLSANLIDHRPHRTGGKTPWQDYYTPELKQMVMETYAADFETFGYDTDF
ncbi:sulfotransferase family 2 domain-containing protein [Yunchengibacter salinarum]|uniref:sulfotransferase family 2 domain-containing protein n=1 Tax=Yunchengibacter salinarum TaxID=3133399 RepID=UPI0035B57A35